MTKKAGGPASGASDVFSVARLRELLDLMKEYDLNELDLMQADQRFVWPVEHRALHAAAPPARRWQQRQPPRHRPPRLPAADGPHIKIIHSPMVGTFYSKPKPGAADFVQAGSRVAADTVVCIVEAMKVFNEIPAEISGTIVEILVSNEEAVDFNRPLFKVDTRG